MHSFESQDKSNQFHSSFKQKPFPRNSWKFLQAIQGEGISEPWEE